MTTPKKTSPTRKHGRHLRVPVLPSEEAEIKKNAAATGLSVATFLRNVGMGYKVQGIVDYERTLELLRVNGDLGRLGGLLKLWLNNDEKVRQLSPGAIDALLRRIESTQEELRRVAETVLRRGSSIRN